MVAACLLAWQAAVSVAPSHSTLLPSPSSVTSYLRHAVADGTLLGAVLETLRRLLIGFAAGAVLGLLSSRLNRRLGIYEDSLDLMAFGLRALPAVCCVPLALLWFRRTESAVLFVVAAGTLWFVLLSADRRLHALPPTDIRAARTASSSGRGAETRRAFSASLPSVASGIRRGWGFAWRSVIAAEIYATIFTGFGLGHLLHFAGERNAVDRVLGVGVIVVVLGLSADKIVFAPIERILRRRRLGSRSLR